IAWAALEDVAAGLVAPPALGESIAKTKREIFGPEYNATREGMLKAMVGGQKTAMELPQWTIYTVTRLATIIEVDETALVIAKDYAAEQRPLAQRQLWTQLALLLLALIVAAGLITLVSRRVTGPLQSIQRAMLQLAGGDLTADVAFAARKDEIGALA